MFDLLKKSSFFIIIAIVIILFFIFSKEEKVESNQELNAILSSENVLDSEVENDTIDVPMKVVIDVKGAVVRPGVYEMQEGTRVNEVIEEAGGFASDADQTQVNLAQKVHDEMVIIIPLLNEQGVVRENVSDSSGKIRLNDATKEEIESLNGIGPSKAEAILQYREEVGYFQSVEDLLEVPGIGDKTLDNLKEYIQVP